MPVDFNHPPDGRHPHDNPFRHKSPVNPPPGTTQADQIRLGGLIQAAVNDGAMKGNLFGQPEQTSGLTQAQLGLLLFNDGTVSRGDIIRGLGIRVDQIAQSGRVELFGLMCSCG